MSPVGTPRNLKFSRTELSSRSLNELSVKTQEKLNFIFAKSPRDSRPYLKVKIFEKCFSGLLDSGATSTIIGNPGWEFLKSCGSKLGAGPDRCVVADGSSCVCLGRVQVPMELEGKTRVISALVVPNIANQLILGVDFWRAMEIVPDLGRDVWSFAAQSPVSAIAPVSTAIELTHQEQVQLDRLIQRLLTTTSKALGTLKVMHEINVVPGTAPIKQKAYRVSPFRQKMMEAELDKMLALGVVEPSNSPWAAPVCMIPKRDGSQRFCIDFRLLNAVTIKDAYPIPNIDDILDNLGNTRYLSTLDIKSAYWQVPLAPEARAYTGFVVPGRGLHQFVRMPFGLSNAPATWQRIIDNVLGEDLKPFVWVYLDDIVVTAPDFPSHLRLLTTVLERLRGAGMVASAEKCKFCRSELKYLGYIIDGQGLRTDPEKVQAMVNIPPPTNAKEVRSFLGMVSWYRRFVEGFSSIATPLTELTKKNFKFVWTPECDAAFTRLKECLISPPVLARPDFTLPFTLQVDASGYGLGGVLTQRFPDGEKVICYISRSLTSGERKFSATERECISCIWGVEKLRYYLEGRRFTIITDHHSLLWLHRLKDPQGRLARWALRLLPYDYEIIHRKGREHVVPDCLSRSVPVQEGTDSSDPAEFACAIDEADETVYNGTDTWYQKMLRNIKRFPESYPLFRVTGGRLFKKLITPTWVEPTSCWKEIPPKEARPRILFACHNIPTSGHMGVAKTKARIFEHYWWPKFQYDVKRYVKCCRVCQAIKPENKRPMGLMSIVDPPTRAWQKLAVDFFGPLPRSTNGHTQILVVTDVFSKFSRLFPVRNATARVACKLLEEQIFLLFGVPEEIQMDNGTPFRSREMERLLDKYGVRAKFNPHFHPQVNNAERVNRTMKTVLRAVLMDRNDPNHRYWDQNLAEIACALCTAKHEATGHTPYFLNFGREMCLHGSRYRRPNLGEAQIDDEERRARLTAVCQKVHGKLVAAAHANKRYYDLRRRPDTLQVGQLVLKRNFKLSDATAFYTSKLGSRYTGPYKIRRKLNPWTLEVEDLNGRLVGVWNTKDLKALPAEACE